MPSHRRLNLFAFTPETDALFGMLIIASITLALFLGIAFGVFFGFGGYLTSIDIRARGLEVTSRYLPILCISAAALLAVLGVAFMIFFRHPVEIRQRRKLAPISKKDQGIQDRIEELAVQAGVRAPDIKLPPQGLRGTNAQAFGVGKTLEIGLDGGFRVLRRTKPDIFNALILHELAHFANEDVGKSYFSNALWKSIRWVIILPFVIGLIGNVFVGLSLGILYGDLLQRFMGPAQVIFKLLVQFSFVLLVAATIWARLLRTREFYADWRVVLWGSQAGLNKIFQAEAETKKESTRLNLWKLHPDATERMDAIEHPELHFRISPWLIFLAGLLLAFLIVGLLYVSIAAFLAFAGILQTIRDSSTGLFYWLARGILWIGIAALILLVFGSIGWLMNSVLVPQIQKQAVLDAINNQRGLSPYLKMLTAACILVAGVELGFFLAPLDILAPDHPAEILLRLLVITPVMVLMAWWYMMYVRSLSLQIAMNQMGRDISVWGNRFMRTASILWGLFFFIPGLVLSRFIAGSLLQLFVYINLGWLVFTLLFSPLVFGATWIAAKWLFENKPKRCPHCGGTISNPTPAIEACEHCEGVLGEWLFAPENL